MLLLFPTTFYGGLAVTALFSFSLASLLMLPDLFIADLVDSDVLITGVRREGLYFGMNGFIKRFAFTIQGLVIYCAARYRLDKMVNRIKSVSRIIPCGDTKIGSIYYAIMLLTDS